MPIEHDPTLVALSLLVAIQASYVGLNLALRVSQAFALNRRLLIAGAALSFAIGIWGDAFRRHAGGAAARHRRLRGASGRCCRSSFACWWSESRFTSRQRSQRLLFIAATVMGVGIASMHYIGMLALHASAHMMHNPVYVLASVLIAVLASGLALWLAFASETRPPLLVCAAVLGCAISGMHYTAMAGLTLHPIVGALPPGTPAISGDLLAVIVSVVAFLVSGVFMLALVPDQRESAADPVIVPEANEPDPIPAPITADSVTPVSGSVAELTVADAPTQATSDAPIYEATLPVEEVSRQPDHQHRRHFLGPRQRTLYLCVQRPGGHLLSALDRRDHRAAAARYFLSRPPQLHRQYSARRASEARGRQRNCRSRFAGAPLGAGEPQPVAAIARAAHRISANQGQLRQRC